MKTRFFTLLLAVLVSTLTVLAERVKIGDLYYNLSAKKQTATVTYHHSNSLFNYADLQTVFIPGKVTYKGVEYKVVSIGNYAFNNCRKLQAIYIPHYVTIGQGAFEGCKNLTKYFVGENQMPYYYPFSSFAKDYVEKRVNEWQKKGEFERTTDWQQRVNEQTRQQKIDELLKDAENSYIAFHTKDITVRPHLGSFDADNEVFALKDETYGTMFVAVPLNEAQDFKRYWDFKTITPIIQIVEDHVQMIGLDIKMPDGKKYTYRNSDAFNYNIAEVEYDFEPIELNIPQHVAIQPGEHNITKTKIRTATSDVDANIPETNASNLNTFVVIIANEDYQSVASVPFALNDGRVLAKYCQRTLGVPAANIKLYENATLNNMRLALAWLKNVCEKYEGEASVIFYYAGHGIPDPSDQSAYLLPVDGDGRYVTTGYKVDELYQKLGAMPAKSTTVLLDACFSGANRDGKMWPLNEVWHSKPKPVCRRAVWSCWQLHKRTKRRFPTKKKDTACSPITC